MNRIIAVLMLLGMTGCAGKNSKPQILGQALKSDLSRTEVLRGLRVKELFVVVFPKNYSVQEWKSIFQDTNILSRNKRRLREIEGQDDPTVEEERATLIGKNAEILLELGTRSLFMMSWSSQDENCKIGKDTLKIVCKPFNPDNPLNGGLPQSMKPISFIIPDPIQSEVKIPYLSIKLEKQGQESIKGFGMELRLKPESESKKQLWFKGDVVMDPESEFPFS